MSYRYLGQLPFAQLVSKKKQRPKENWEWVMHRCAEAKSRKKT